MVKAVFWICGLALVGVVVAVAVSGGGSGLERTGYFKDDARFRVMAFRAEGPLDRAAAEAALAGVMHSTGAHTWAVIYQPGARDPGHLLTSAASRSDALDLIMAPPFDGWAWYLSIRHDGLRSLKPR